MSIERTVRDASTLGTWRRSSYSGGGNGDCLEVCDAYAPWRKSSYSGGNGGNCLEVSDAASPLVPVRDSKDPHGPAVVFPAGAWSAFVEAVKGGPLAG